MSRVDTEASFMFRELVKRAVSNYLYLGDRQTFDAFRATRSYYDTRRFEWKLGVEARPMTLLGRRQLDRLETLMLKTLKQRVPGDYLEAGVWNGGATIFMAAVLKSLDVSDRKVWVADTFDGIPRSRRTVGDPVDGWPDRWRAGLSKVRNNFRRFDLLGPQVRFVRGDFAKSLARTRIGPLALVRLDADSYESTLAALLALYPKLSVGGYLIVDDWHLPGCRQAVLEFRRAFHITEPIDESLNAQWQVRRPWVGR